MKGQVIKMILNQKDDWKQFLSLEDEERLNDFLRKISKYRGAYKNASEVKGAQMWSAILELRKENLLLQKRLDRMQDLLEGMMSRVKVQDEEDRKLFKSLDRF